MSRTMWISVVSEMGVTVECELDGQSHGASTIWAMTPDHDWREHVGWYEHGLRCGQWRDTPELAPPGNPEQVQCDDSQVDHP